MALENKKVVGVWSVVSSSVFLARTFDSGVTWYLTQETPELEKGSFMLRDRRLISTTNGTFTKATTITNDDVALLKQATDGDEFGVKLSNEFIIPAGYVKKISPSGQIYFINTLDASFVDENKDGIDDATQVRSTNILTTVTDWIKANPLLSVGIGVVILFVVNKLAGGKKSKKGFLANLF